MVTDRLGPVAVLDELHPDVEIIDVGKTPGHHPVPQHEIGRILVEQAQRGASSSGSRAATRSCTGGAARRCSPAARPASTSTVVPGVSSAFAAPAAAGIPLTHRGTVGAVHVMNGHDGWSAAALTGLREASCTVVVLMGVSALADPGRRGARRRRRPGHAGRAGRGGHAARPARHARRLDDVVDVAAAAGVRAPAVIVLGAVAAAGLLETGQTSARATSPAATMAP